VQTKCKPEGPRFAPKSLNSRRYGANCNPYFYSDARGVGRFRPPHTTWPGRNHQVHSWFRYSSLALRNVTCDDLTINRDHNSLRWRHDSRSEFRCATRQFFAALRLFSLLVNFCLLMERKLYPPISKCNEMVSEDYAITRLDWLPKKALVKVPRRNAEKVQDLRAQPD
jgi:hypothetical protein